MTLTEIFQQSYDCDGIGCREDGASGEREAPVQTEGQHVVKHEGGEIRANQHARHGEQQAAGQDHEEISGREHGLWEDENRQRAEQQQVRVDVDPGVDGLGQNAHVDHGVQLEEQQALQKHGDGEGQAFQELQPRGQEQRQDGQHQTEDEHQQVLVRRVMPPMVSLFLARAHLGLQPHRRALKGVNNRVVRTLCDEEETTAQGLY
eukprot:scaffold83_cov246-Pinguiococcus_pyrenoidosus.AAC.2